MNRWMSEAIQAQVETITPELAREMLATSKGNRAIRQTHVEWLSQMMKQGVFNVTHQGVGFLKNGTLIDGHHRLLAAVKSGCTVKMLVTRGLGERVYLDIDQVTKRTSADIFQHSRKISEIISLIGFATCNMRHSRDLAPLFDSRFRNIAEELMGYCSSTAAIYSKAAVRGAVVVIAFDPNLKDGAFRAYRNLVTKNYVDLTPALASFCRATDGKNWGGATGPMDLFAMTIQAILKWDEPAQYVRFTALTRAASLTWAREIVRNEIEKGGAR